MSRQTANHVPRSFRIFSKHPSDISQTYCKLIPGQLRAKSSKSSKSQVPREAYSSHLLIGPFRSTPTYPESRALTQRHIYFLSLSLSYKYQASHCQEGPSGHGSSRPLPGGSILWCQPGGEAVPEGPDAANRFLGVKEGVASFGVTPPPTKDQKSFPREGGRARNPQAYIRASSSPPESKYHFSVLGNWTSQEGARNYSSHNPSTSQLPVFALSYPIEPPP